ncbi:MAG: HdeD family acid-resistance protein [Aequorivita sp.]
MESTVLSTVKSSAKNWWLSLILGVLFILLGIWVIRTPLASYISLSMLFSVFIFISGIFGIVFSISNRKEMEGWGWHLTGGILDLMIGSLLVLHPAITMTILPFFVGFWILFRGVFGIGLSFQLRSFGVPNWGLLLVFGILTVLFSFLLLLNPVFTGLGIVYMTAFAFIVMGIFRIILAFNLKRIHKYLKNF